jgi:hypothetical protein
MKRYDARFTRISTMLVSAALSGFASAGELPQGGSVADVTAGSPNRVPARW